MTSPSHPRGLTRSPTRTRRRTSKRRTSKRRTTRKTTAMLHRRCHSTAESHAVERCSESHRSLRHPQRRRTRIQGPPRSSNSSMCRRRAFSRRSQSSSRRRSSTTSSRHVVSSCQDKLLLLQKDLHDRMVRSDDCLSNCNQDVIPQLMAYANYINEEARLSGSTVYWIKLLPGQGTPVAGEISSLVRILPTSFLIHLILILLMRRIQPLLQLCLV